MDSTRKRKIRIGVSVALFILVLLLLVIITIACQMGRNAYMVPGQSRHIDVTAREAIGPGVLEVSFTNDEGDTVPGWYKAGTKRGAIVFLHGLGGNRAQLASIAVRMNDEGWGILLIDQRGHGEHTANLTTLGRGESEDALAAVRWLRGRSEIDESRIGLYGASMGATAVIYAAARDTELACAVADSSYADFLQQEYHDLNMEAAPVHVPRAWQGTVLGIFNTVSPLIVGKWANYPDPVDVVGDIECPLFLIHGENDTRIDPSQFDLLSRTAREADVEVTSWLVEGKGHCSYHHSDEFIWRLTGFYREHLD